MYYVFVSIVLTQAWKKCELSLYCKAVGNFDLLTGFWKWGTQMGTFAFHNKSQLHVGGPQMASTSAATIRAQMQRKNLLKKWTLSIRSGGQLTE